MSDSTGTGSGWNLQPDPNELSFDFDRVLSALVLVHTRIPENALTAEGLGTERAGNGDDVDMIVMQHQYIYEREGALHSKVSSMVVKGDDQVHTGIAKTVGLPAAIAAKLILQGKVPQRGVRLPIYKEIYAPILRELEGFGIVFEHSEFRLAEKPI